MDLLARLGLRCADGDRSGCRGTCEHEAGDWLGRKWDRCPVAEIESDAHLQAVRNLRALARLSPLSDFPAAYTAGAVQTWLAIDAEIDARVNGGGDG